MADQQVLPTGWEKSRTGECVVHRTLDDFRYAEVRFDPHKSMYVLYKVCVDGPRQEDERGRYDDLTKAMRQGDYL